jgi:hypothetical protein
LGSFFMVHLSGLCESKTLLKKIRKVIKFCTVFRFSNKFSDPATVVQSET